MSSPSSFMATISAASFAMSVLASTATTSLTAGEEPAAYMESNPVPAPMSITRLMSPFLVQDAPMEIPGVIYVQGDSSGLLLAFVDIKLKVAFCIDVSKRQ